MLRTTALALVLSSVALAGLADAATILTVVGGDIETAASWDNGLPSATNPGTIAINASMNASDTFNFGAVVDHTAGDIVCADGFNMMSGTWNMSSTGKIDPRYFLSNGSSTVFNISAGLIELKSSSTNFISTANGGKLNVSGSAVLNAATNAAQSISTPNGDINFATGWTGSWSVGSFSGNDWKNLFTSDTDMKVDGANIDAATFDATFVVTDGGQTLSMIPEPSTFALTTLGLLGLIGFGRRRKR